MLHVKTMSIITILPWIIPSGNFQCVSGSETPVTIQVKVTLLFCKLLTGVRATVSVVSALHPHIHKNSRNIEMISVYCECQVSIVYSVDVVLPTKTWEIIALLLICRTWMLIQQRSYRELCRLEAVSDDICC